MDSLVIPVPMPSAPVSHAEVYKARRGDTLVTIADRFGVSLDDLHRWNHASGIVVVAGQRIRVSEPLHLAPHSRDRSRKKADKQGASKEAGITSGSHKKSGAAASTKTQSKSASKRHNDKAAHKSGESKTAKTKSNAHSKTARNKNVQK